MRVLSVEIFREKRFRSLLSFGIMQSRIKDLERLFWVN